MSRTLTHVNKIMLDTFDRFVHALVYELGLLMPQTS